MPEGPFCQIRAQMKFNIFMFHQIEQDCQYRLATVRIQGLSFKGKKRAKNV